MLIDDIRNHLAVMNVGQRERRTAVLLREAVAEIERLRLTDAEREAVARVIATLDGWKVQPGDAGDAATLRGLLERMTLRAKQ